METIESTQAAQQPQTQATPNIGNAMNGINQNYLGTSGIAGGAASGAAAGTAVLPGWGTAAGAVIGGIAGAFSSQSEADRDEEQIRQQEGLTDIQLRNSEQLTDYQRASQLEYQREVYGAQLAGLKANGLNPALIYGGSGGGGSTGGGAVTVGGGQAADTASEENADTNERSQESNAILQAAQTAATVANTTKTKAETDNITMSTGKLAVETQNANILQQGLILDNTIKQATAYVTDSTKFASVQTIMQTLDNLTLQSQKLQTEINANTIANTTARKTQEATIEAVNLNVKAIITGIIKNQSETKLNNAQAEALSEKIAQGWQELQIQAQGQQVSKENVAAMTTTMLKVAGIQAAAQMVTTAANAFLRKSTPTNTSSHTTVLDGDGNIKSETYGTTKDW